MKRMLLSLSLILPLAFLVGFGQYTVPTYSAGSLGNTAPTVIAYACAGGANGGTTSPINTTGATLIVVATGSIGSYTAATDSKLNGHATTYLDYYNSGSTITGSIQYWLTPTVGTGHTFTYSASSSYAGFCVYAVSGVTGVADAISSSNIITTNATSCQAGSITPGSGTHIVFAETYDNTSGETPSLGSSYAVPIFLASSGGSYIGAGAGYLVTSSATNPNWTGFTSQPLTCLIASFH